MIPLLLALAGALIGQSDEEQSTVQKRTKSPRADSLPSRRRVDLAPPEDGNTRFNRRADGRPFRPQLDEPPQHQRRRVPPTPSRPPDERRRRRGQTPTQTNPRTKERFRPPARNTPARTPRRSVTFRPVTVVYARVQSPSATQSPIPRSPRQSRRRSLPCGGSPSWPTTRMMASLR
jgi:hypothetical protein